MPDRPPPPHEIADDLEWQAVPSPDWRVAEGKKCRHQAARLTCGAPSAAELNRKANRWTSRERDSWWAYCAAHLAGYGNWIEDGQVVHWRAVEKAGTDG